MEEICMGLFYDKINELLTTLCSKEKNNIELAGNIIANAICNGGILHTFGTGHSVGFGMEMSGRPGSLACIHQINTSDFVLEGVVTLADFKDQNNIFERRPGIAERLYDLYNIKKEDVFIIISNSGINGLVIDMAILAKERNHKVIVITSLKHTKAEASRHPSGKKLYELADVVIDNCGPQGDALIETGGTEKICSASSITGGFIAQSLTTEACRVLHDKGCFVPVYKHEDSYENIEFNRKLKEQYGNRI